MDLYYLGGKNDPDRNVAASTVKGHGIFLRTAYEVHCVRTYFIGWRAQHFVTQEGDPNYGQLLTSRRGLRH